MLEGLCLSVGLGLVGLHLVHDLVRLHALEAALAGEELNHDHGEAARCAPRRP